MYKEDELLAQDGINAAKADDVEVKYLDVYMKGFIAGHARGYMDAYDIGYQEALMMVEPYSEGESGWCWADERA
ncbi:hypothetical protein [Bifidobacterium magnum]|uniref:Uncharacterized protein n=1 Tax=Bifidobacterium magnum TaxID=1692 RepID=A0A087B9M5_9BIFI|nr:hypothetical protein [Bifidobacterium magnum]KFI67725.1 hypothetical protein BMAGN_1535 [Bifidobacterium magnum]